MDALNLYVVKQCRIELGLDYLLAKKRIRLKLYRTSTFPIKLQFSVFPLIFLS